MKWMWVVVATRIHPSDHKLQGASRVKTAAAVIWKLSPHLHKLPRGCLQPLTKHGGNIKVGLLLRDMGFLYGQLQFKDCLELGRHYWTVPDFTVAWGSFSTFFPSLLHWGHFCITDQRQLKPFKVPPTLFSLMFALLKPFHI